MILDDFYLLVGQQLGITGVAESLNAEDKELIASRYVLVHDQLQNLGLTTWGVTEDVPDFAALPVAMMLAAYSVDDFTIPEPRRSRLRLEGLIHLSPVSFAERALRIQLAHRYEPTVNSAEYF